MRFAAALALAVTASLAATEAAAQSGRLDYPEARRADVVDTYHGVEIADPYRWLEEPDTPESRAWLAAQDELLEAYLADSPVRDRVRHRIEAIQSFERIGLAIPAGGRTFYASWPDGTIDLRLHVLDEPGGEGRFLADAATLFDDPELRIARYVPSPDGRHLLLRVARGPSAWETLRVYDVEAGTLLPDSIGNFHGGRGSVSWAGDGSGFYYVRFEIPEERGGVRNVVERPEIRFHRLGEHQVDDRLVHHRPDHPDWLLFPGVTPDGRWLVVNVLDPEVSENRITVLDLADPARAPVRLVPEPDATYAYEANEGSTFLIRTTKGAPLNRLVAIDLERPAPEHWREVIPESDDAMNTIARVGDRLVVRYVRDARHILALHHLDGRFIREIELPAFGFVGAMPDHLGADWTTYGLSVQYDPGTVYRLDARTGSSERLLRPELAFDPDDYTTRQIFYEARDGTRIPMFLVHRDDVEPGPDTPVWMYGYGAFGWSAYPWFQAHMIAWLDLGGVYALPSIRGGGEYGEAWWEAGRGLNETTSIDDFVDAGEALVERGLASRELLVANGGSASGPLAGATLARRPDHFGAAVIEYPTLDMLRYHRFGGWPSEFGTVEDREAFRVLLSYSPLHVLEPGACYPPTLVQAGAKDEVVSPVHAYKYVAALQAAQGCPNPVLLLVAEKAGHNLGSTPGEVADTAAAEFAFLWKVLHMEVPEGGLADPGVD